jgi:hypothetical protein
VSETNTTLMTPSKKAGVRDLLPKRAPDPHGSKRRNRCLVFQFSQGLARKAATIFLWLPKHCGNIVSSKRQARLPPFGYMRARARSRWKS